VALTFVAAPHEIANETVISVVVIVRIRVVLNNDLMMVSFVGS